MLPLAWHGLVLFGCTTLLISQKGTPLLILAVLGLNIYTLVCFSSPAYVCTTLVLSTALLAAKFSPNQFPFALVVWVSTVGIVIEHGADKVFLVLFGFASLVFAMYAVYPNPIALLLLVSFFTIFTLTP